MESFEAKNYNIFEMFNKQWALVTAGDPSHYNTCTIGWGSLGSIWRGKEHAKAIATVYVNPDRYTWEFLKESDTFTIAFFPEEYREALSYLGSHSGRDGDKVAAAGLTPREIAGGVSFREANLTFVCRKLYQAPFLREGMAEEISQGIYKNWQPHWEFIGEIIEVEDRR